MCQYRGGGDLVIDRVPTWLCGAGMGAVCTMKVAVRQAGSFRRMGGDDGQLEQWVGFARVLLGNELWICSPLVTVQNTICGSTHSCSRDGGHNDARNMLR